MHSLDRQTRMMGAASKDVHVFTTQFFSKLEMEGAKAVASWTKNKSLDIFEKKFIFIPVNRDLHWSLFVVVNAGEVVSAHQSDDEANVEHPFILFMDSSPLTHNYEKLSEFIRGWLNLEAKKYCKFNLLGDEPFHVLHCPTIVPEGKSCFLCIL